MHSDRLTGPALPHARVQAKSDSAEARFADGEGFCVPARILQCVNQEVSTHGLPPLGKSPEDDLLLQVQGIVSEYERAKIMERSRRGKKHTAQREPRVSNSAVAVDQKQWVFLPAPAIVDNGLFNAAQEQLRENRTRARLGMRRPGYLPQGLTCCALCGYAFYGKTFRQRGRGRVLRDFNYYRRSGTDGYRFGGERICSNTQSRADILETEIWENVCKILKNPGILEQEDHDSSIHGSGVPENVDRLRAQRQKLQHGIDRLLRLLTETRTRTLDPTMVTSRA